MNIHGSKKGSSKPRQPVIAPDSAQSKTFISIMYGLGEGEIAGLADGYKSVYLDDTPLQNDDGEFNFTGVKVDFRAGTNDQTPISGFAMVENKMAVGVELRSDKPFVRTINNRELSAVRVRLNFNALKQHHENGDITGYAISHAIDIQTDGGAFKQVLSDTVRGKSLQGYKKSHRIHLPNKGAGEKAVELGSWGFCYDDRFKVSSSPPFLQYKSKA